MLELSKVRNPHSRKGKVLLFPSKKKSHLFLVLPPFWMCWNVLKTLFCVRAHHTADQLYEAPMLKSPSRLFILLINIDNFQFFEKLATINIDSFCQIYDNESTRTQAWRRFRDVCQRLVMCVPVIDWCFYHEHPPSRLSLCTKCMLCWDLIV